MMEKIDVAGRLIGEGEIPYIIAEIGSNHNGDMDLCRKQIDLVKNSGADAVKFQSWDKKSLICQAEYKRNTSYSDTKKHFGTLEEMVVAYQFTPEMHRDMRDYCREVGVTFLSSAFAPHEVQLLEELEAPLHKVASMDINNPVLLKEMALTKKPVILSTGMSSLGEIEKALEVLERAGSGPVALLHCIAVYPPAFEDINLRNMETLRRAFGKPVGFSDHSIGVTIPLAAIALGACIIEKHFTSDKNMDGWDHDISADLEEMAIIVTAGRNIQTALGSSRRSISEAEMKKRRAMRRRIVLRRPMKAGEQLTMKDIDYKRPGNGINPDESDYVVGRSLTRDCDYDHELEWGDLV